VFQKVGLGLHEVFKYFNVTYCILGLVQSVGLHYPDAGQCFCVTHNTVVVYSSFTKKE